MGQALEFCVGCEHPRDCDTCGDLHEWIMEHLDAEPVRRGMWLNFCGDFSTAECELCSELYEVSPNESPKKEFFDAFKEFYKFCPNCGAEMDDRS